MTELDEQTVKDRLAGAVAGMVLGDALGVPGELWPREKLRARFGYIDQFLDGPEDNIVACYFKAGQYTDDSAQAFVILKALMREKKVPAPKVLADDLLAWVAKMNGFEINLLGPSSKASLLAWSEGKDASEVTKLSLTNGAAMRIAPVGGLVPFDRSADLARVVAQVSQVTHHTDIAISGAAMVAQAVASAIAGRSWDEIREDIFAMESVARSLGHPTWAAKISSRILAFEAYAKAYPNVFDSDTAYGDAIYDVVGTGTMTSESVSAALLIALYAKEPLRAALLCANLGGDTDTIGAMACAICGAKVGLSAMPANWVQALEDINGLDFKALASEIYEARQHFAVPSEDSSCSA